MATARSEIDAAAREFIAAQRVFFVATAPLAAAGRVNLSPKGLDTLRVLSPRRVAYLDYTGSGVETIAHVRENGRLTIMFCALEGRANILRLQGRGRVVEAGEVEGGDEFAALLPEFGVSTPPLGVRAIIVLEVERVADSCGFGVPRYRYQGERDELAAWNRKKGEQGLREYWGRKNAASIDGLKGL
ncbi:MAG: pyridoxamine 5'-phosphate oxidase family protein [Phycisphaerales bacterium]|nr:pyridoxamine 5'-phosphate oxidase family protein [Phycisphaerales bacterium]